MNPRQWIIVGVALLCISEAVVEGTEWQKAKFETLKFVQLIMRHGDRNPIYSYPKDPNKNNPNFYPEGMQALTLKGVKQTHDLGKFFRARYDGFLSRAYSQDEIDAWSSHKERAVRSGISFLRGLYPKDNPGGGGDKVLSLSRRDDKFDDGEVSQVVPIRTVPNEKDNFIYMDSKLCPEIGRLEDENVLKSKENTALEERSKEMVRTISENTGLKNELAHAGIFFDQLICQRHQNKTLPKWTTPEMIAFAEDYMIFRLTSETKTWEMKQLRAKTIQKTLENMERKVEDKSWKKLKFILYSGHDRTIISFLNILKIFNHLRTEYASGILIELHQDPRKEKDHYLEIYYRNDSRAEPYKLEMEECRAPCYLPKFRRLTQPLFLDDYDKACKRGFAAYMAPSMLLVLVSLALTSI